MLTLAGLATRLASMATEEGAVLQDFKSVW